jgi:transposase-like protein
MNRATKRNWTEKQARPVHARAEREGLSTAELARTLNVSAQKIYWWRHCLEASRVKTIAEERDALVDRWPPLGHCRKEEDLLLYVWGYLPEHPRIA